MMRPVEKRQWRVVHHMSSVARDMTSVSIRARWRVVRDVSSVAQGA